MGQREKQISYNATYPKCLAQCEWTNQEILDEVMKKNKRGKAK